MQLKQNGKSTLKTVEVTNISSNGIWLILKNEEYYLSYSDFPWFKESTVKDILNVELLKTNHLYWPDLDIDLDIDSIKNVEKYPLIFSNEKLSVKSVVSEKDSKSNKAQKKE